MKKISRFIALFLALIMCVSCFAACGDGEGETTTAAETTVADTTASAEDTTAPDEETTGEPAVTTEEPSETSAPHVHNYKTRLVTKFPTCTLDGAEKLIVVVNDYGVYYYQIESVVLVCVVA